MTNSEVISLSLRKAINSIIKKENLTEYEIEVEDLNKNGVNCLSKVYAVDIKGVIGDCEREINIIVKKKVFLKKAKMFNDEQIIANELLMYKDIYKVMTHLQDQANVPPEDRFKIPKIYDETIDEEIIFENITKKGFKLYDRFEPVTLKYFELGVQEMAKLHALSFVIEKKTPEYFKEKISVLGCAFHFDVDSVGMMGNVIQYVANLYDGETKAKIENFVPVFIEKVAKYYKDNSNIRALTHGDYKQNNIMLRRIDGEPVEIMALDYQLITYACPIKDFLLFIFSATEREFRREHMNDLKELYFETLSRFLKYFDVTVETVFPRAEFEKLFMEFRDYGAILALFYMFSVFAPPVEADLPNEYFNDIPFLPDERYHSRIRGYIEDLKELGYL